MIEKDILVPSDVPKDKIAIFTENYRTLTHGNSNLFLFSVDQKIEHLNDYFIGQKVDPEDAHPQHLFEIAEHSPISAMVTHLGLIAHYAHHYRAINYIVKLNAKTHLVPTSQQDPMSAQLYTVADVINFKQTSNLPILGIACTIYPGSEFEHEMLEFAAQSVLQAHLHGLIATLWIYPRGKAVKNERDGNLIAGAAGLANSLGADFVKINEPDASKDRSSLEWLNVAVQAAGNTKVLCAGGESIEPELFLKKLYEQLHQSGTAGCAVGRNIHQKSMQQAIGFCKAIAQIIFNKASLKQAVTYLI